MFCKKRERDGDIWRGWKQSELMTQAKLKHVYAEAAQTYKATEKKNSNINRKTDIYNLSGGHYSTDSEEQLQATFDKAWQVYLQHL